MLTNQTKLAKTSASPGKTQLSTTLSSTIRGIW
ncbi:MAG: hypothetical protein QM743_05835 [Chitinophagaceae bacterium]